MSENLPRVAYFTTLRTPRQRRTSDVPQHRTRHGGAAPEHLLNWIEANRADMRPPVSNKYLYDGQDFFAMCIAGPNARNDFHITDSEEFFLQLQGDIVVTLLEEAGPRHVRIREGETS